jgi:hypothetical protein
MKIHKPYQDYYTALQAIDVTTANEHTYRTAFENFINGIIASMKPKITVIHERTAVGRTKFRPDFIVEVDKQPISAIETKKIGENIKDLISSAQIDKYRKQYDNVLLTNYVEFVWLERGEKPKVANLCSLLDVIEKREMISERAIFAVKEVLTGFFRAKVQYITDLTTFANRLGDKGSVLREHLEDEIYYQQKNEQTGELYQLFARFKKNIQDYITIETFSNAFAQTVVYGIFMARLNSENEKITLQNAKSFVTESFLVLKELVAFFDNLEKPELQDAFEIVKAVLVTFNNYDSDTIRKSLSFSRKKEKTQEELFDDYDPESDILDPYLYFYEPFLTAFDATMKKARGVYYTPPEVVNFIVRVTDEVLRYDFAIQKGIADHNVTILDFATGTGAFLLAVFRQILEPNSPQSYLRVKGGKKVKEAEVWEKEGIIAKHLLKNMYGFEYLLAPYAVAHLKLSQYLREQGYQLDRTERLQVYLTNTLTTMDVKDGEIDYLTPALQAEGRKAQEIKEMPILVIMGNPPYSNFKKDKDSQEYHVKIQELLEDYKEGLNEKKINIDDDYVKFIRFAHHKIMQKGHGVFSVITNNSYLDGVTHRQMRKKLYEDFDKIYIINLHGNAIKKEPDTNVFDIRVGVSIAIFVKLDEKSKKRLKEKEVYYFSTLENGIKRRQAKQTFLKNHIIELVQWAEIKPIAPYYWFTNKPIADETYRNYYPLDTIFKDSGSAVKTDRDTLFIDKNINDLRLRINLVFNNEYNEEEKSELNIRDSSSYNLLDRISRFEYDPDKLQKYTYRPFQNHFIYYQNGLISRPAFNTMQHIFDKQNKLLLFTRIWDTGEWSGSFVSSNIADIHSVGGQTYAVPLYLFDNETSEKTENFTSEFREFINQKYDRVFSAEQILGYIYAILHSPTYREKYAEELKINFPKIPFVATVAEFEKLSALGMQLVQVHLLEEKPVTKRKLRIYGNDKKTRLQIDLVKYDKKNKWLYVAESVHISPVPVEVWEFEIGGYQVLDKWLKDRREDILSVKEVAYFLQVIEILQFTIEQMQKIDEVLKL